MHRTGLAIAFCLLAPMAVAHPIGYRVPLAGGATFAEDASLFAFVAAHEILKSQAPGTRPVGMASRAIPRDPAAIKRLSYIESVNHPELGALQVVYLPTWCGHRDATDHIAYVLRVTPNGRQLVGRMEYDGPAEKVGSSMPCRLSSAKPYRFVCDSYHGAKGWSIQEWKGKTFQWAPVSP